jgi:UDP-glucose:(glucosyl)LPS alpha-1,2-glucosyltransferase
MGLRILNNEEDDSSFSFNDPAPTHNAMGGTELQMKWLYEHVDNDLLNHFQIIPSRVRNLEDKPRILWCHDTADDPEMQHLKSRSSLDRFEKLVFVSHWQRQQYEWFLGIPPSKSYVIPNAIRPIPEHEKPTDKINLIYHTTPHRGLEILVPVFDALCNHFDNLHLDVYSSFSIYGWEKRDEPYKGLFDRCRDHPNITYHGAVSNDEIRKALTKAHIFAYPSIWPETSCIAAIEAMSANCAVVAPTFAALPETLSKFGFMYPYHEDVNEHAQIFLDNLGWMIENINTDNMVRSISFQKSYSDTYHNWSLTQDNWTRLLCQLKK